jgi:cytochrome P450
MKGVRMTLHPTSASQASDEVAPGATIARHFNLYDPRLNDDPWTPLHELQDKCPVAFTEEAGGHWLITSYEEVHNVLSRPELFSSRWTAVPAPANPIPQIPINLDPPEHTKYRRLFTTLFSPNRIRSLEGATEELARQYAKPYAEHGGGDFVKEFAIPFPCVMFLRVFGLPESDLNQLLAWKDIFLRDYVSDDEDRKRAAEQVIPEMLSYFGTVVQQRRAAAAPQDDVMEALLVMEIDGRPLSSDELARILLLFMLAGLDTVTNTLALAVALLAERPYLREQIVADPSIIPSATEELLRYTSIVTTCRQANEDVDVGGVRIAEGDWVAAVLPIASRDPSVFAEPDSIDFSRKNIRHMAFGVGPHRCLGSHLARLEIATALRVLHEFMPEYALQPGTAPQRHFGAMMGCGELLLTVAASGSRAGQ